MWSGEWESRYLHGAKRPDLAGDRRHELVHRCRDVILVEQACVVVVTRVHERAVDVAEPDFFHGDPGAAQHPRLDGRVLDLVGLDAGAGLDLGAPAAVAPAEEQAGADQHSVARERGS